MSEGDVSLIRDEDVLRRMWQQTEDFSRKKEIRAHMYRLREERLRNLYSPEPKADGKGCEFTAAQGHVQSFADQTFQSMKSKEVRDAGSPPKEFTYRGQDLKELSNAGWNVESDSRTTDDGHTHVKSVHANIEGKYDVEGGRGQFAAADRHQHAVTEYHDDNSSLKRNESSSNTAAREHVVRQTDDGTQISSSTSSSTSTSKFQQVSSTKHETVPYLTNDDYDQSRQTYDTNRNEEYSRRQVQSNDFEQNLRTSNIESGELVSRKVDYPDDNTKVIVETRCLPDGTRVTSTRREFRAPLVQSSCSEQHSQTRQMQNESVSSYSTSQKRSEIKESSSKTVPDTADNKFSDIVDSQRNVDNFDFKRNQSDYLKVENDRVDQQRQTVQRSTEQQTTQRDTNRSDVTTTQNNRNIVEQKSQETSYVKGNEEQIHRRSNTTSPQRKQNVERTVQETRFIKGNDKEITHNTNLTGTRKQNVGHDIHETTFVQDNQDRSHQVTTENKVDETVLKKITHDHHETTNDQYQTTYQSEFTPKKKISNDWSPTHQAWASTLRADTPPRQSSPRASSPGGRTLQSSTSSLRSSVSPDKTYRKPTSRGGSPTKGDRYSPSRSIYSSTHSTHSSINIKSDRNSPQGRPPMSTSPTRASPDRKTETSPERKPPAYPGNQRASKSPESKRPNDREETPTRAGLSPERKPKESTETPRQATQRPSVSPDRKHTSPLKESPRTTSPTRPVDSHGFPTRSSLSPEKNSPRFTPTNLTRETSPKRPLDRDGVHREPSRSPEKTFSHRPSVSPDKKLPNNYPKASSPTRNYPDNEDNFRKPGSRPSLSPEKISSQPKPTTPNKERPNDKDMQRNVSPDRKPSYMRPTAASKHSPSSDFPNTSKLIKASSPDRKFPNSQSPDRNVSKTTSKITEDHYKFIDEETKMYTQIDTKVAKKQTSPSPNKYSCPTDVHGKSPSPTRKPSQDTLDCVRPESPHNIPRSTLRKDSRSPSPTKGPVTFTHDYLEKNNEKITINTEISLDTNEFTKDIKKQPQVKDSPTKKEPTREPSPTKYGTYEKKQRRSEEVEEITTTNTIDTKYDSLTRREKSSSPKKIVDSPISPVKKSPRDSVSPVKSVKDSKYKHTTDFISTEKTTEASNKITTKERPRQLVTPSTSPSRKPKTIDTEPSTGQSSPTTSVSGFVYFSSPRTEKTIVTDLDDDELQLEDTSEEVTTVFKRPESLDIKRSPSPSKIPCRSPQDKQVPSDSLPRKSSLKKPTSNSTRVSPLEKPPSSFQVSPTVETQDFIETTSLKKGKPDKSIASPMKSKPPLERRETYDERCRKILGMPEPGDTTKSTKTVTKETWHLKTQESNTSSPSVSPCHSPKDESPIREIETNDKLVNNSTETIKVTEFLTREKEDILSSQNTSTIIKKSKTPSRDNSPTKLKDIIATKTTDIRDAGKRSSQSPERKPEYQKSPESKPRLTTDKPQNTSASVYTQDDLLIRAKPSPSDKTGENEPKTPVQKHSRTPSPSKKTTINTENITNFITSEREQEILDRVQKSLRKLSPDRSQKSPSREKSPPKTLTSLQDISSITTVDTTHITDNTTDITETQTIKATKEPPPVKPMDTSDKPKDKSVLNKPSSRNISPVKKPISESPDKSRSISPKKTFSGEPQSPQYSKPSGIKPRESVPSHLTRKPTPAVLSPTKSDKTIITTDSKKITKQNSFTKTSAKTTANKTSQSVTNKTVESEVKKIPATKSVPTPKKDHVTRTPSDSSIKPKKTSPQRMRSKPEIQVNDTSTSKTTKNTTSTTTNKTSKSTIKEPQSRLPSKPKSATALNTYTDEDDIIIDVQLAKSSRENSPDRICPTPVGIAEDIGTPRFPDEVSEPDDEFRRRTHHTIHETETIVDDIVEICEDDELFVKRTNIDRVTGSDECLLSVNDKVSKFTNKIDNVTKPKDITSQFKDTEIHVHSDFNLKSDECLLSVSEKVNKFAKGPKNPNDNKSPSRRIVDEYDKHTTYQDDYTKLSVNDKAHLFVETAESIKTPKVKPAQKIERPDLSNVDDSLKTDDCLLSVSDKVNKFVKTAEQFLNETHEVDEKDKKIKEEHERITKKIMEKSDEETIETLRTVVTEDTGEIHETFKGKKTPEHVSKVPSFAKETTSSHGKLKDISSPNLKPKEKTPTVKITTLRSSEAVKKAKALFENIATTQQKTKDVSHTKTTKLTDIGVVKKSPKTDSTIVLHPSLEDDFPIIDVDSEVDAPHVPPIKDHTSKATPMRLQQPGKHYDERTKSPNRLGTQSPSLRTVSPMRQVTETSTVTAKTVLTKQPADHRAESPRQTQREPEKVPGYQRPTKTSQNKEETKVTEEIEVSSRRGSGKFGIELRRTSVERSTTSSERRRSVEHHQPCIEDIFDQDLLEQMLEKVVGYEQRRRIRAQIRVAKKKAETEHVVDYNTHARTTKHSTITITKHKSPDRHLQSKSPERKSKVVVHKPTSPERHGRTPQKTIPVDDGNRVKETYLKPVVNGHNKETKPNDKHQRPHSPTKPTPKLVSASKSPIRHPSPDKRTRPTSPSKAAPKSKQNRFNEYASAYMKKVGLNEADKITFAETKSKRLEDTDKSVKYVEESKTIEKKSTIVTRSQTERKSSKDIIEIVNINGKRTPSPEKMRSPERMNGTSVEMTRQRSTSPILKRQKSDTNKKETIIKTVYDIEKKIQLKTQQEEKPSWVTNRILKKNTSENRTYSSKKTEPEKPKYRATSPSKVISKPIDVITSSYGPGPLDADGRPLFGIKALRSGATNYQVKGTVVRQEFHSRNGSAPEGTVSVTAYSNEPDELERLLQVQGERPSRLHGLAAITTTKKFGGDTGTTLKEAHTKEDQAALEQFTHQDRKVTSTRPALEMDRSREEARERTERREDRKTVRQSSVKSLTEKYIKSASETSKSERSAYPKAGLILRTATMKDSVSSDSSAHAGLARTDSEHSLASVEDTAVTTTTTVTDRSFLDSSAKVTGVQDIITRMKNADIVIQEGDSSEDAEARALLNKFLGATVLMAGMQSYVAEQPRGKVVIKQETVRSSGGKTTTNRSVEEFDLDQCWDERVLRKLLDECSDYEQRRRLRARIRTLMAEQEACASAVTEALAAAGEPADSVDNGSAREEEEVTTVTSSVRRNSSEKTVSSSTTTTKTSKVTESVRGPKPVSPFAKFRQLEKQNSTNSPNSPKTPQSPGSPSAPYFKFTDPAVHASALTIKERLLQWCRDKTRDYENVKLENFSTSWADGLAFCALVHHFLPTTFDYSKLTADRRRHNFTLAFKVADEKAGIYPLLDVDDMVAMRKPDWKCVFTYVQSIHRRFKDQD